MAVVSNTLIGKTRGSIGGVTFASWKGINVAKSKAEQVANPNSTGQQTQRSKFATAVSLYKQMSALVQFGFAQLAIKKSAYNAFASKNLTNGSITQAAPDAIGVPANFFISDGTLTATPINSVDAIHGEPYIKVYFPEALSGNQLQNDVPLIAIANASGSIVATSINNGIRDSGNVSVEMPTTLTNGQIYKVYLGFYQPSTRRASLSAYQSVTVTA